MQETDTAFICLFLLLFQLDTAQLHLGVDSLDGLRNWHRALLLKADDILNLTLLDITRTICYLLQIVL